ncbi:MAG: hypothetical protein AAGJ18_20925 [Bacteroidota bacterium]
MVNYTKSQPPPPSLAIEKAKGINGKYNHPDVLERLQKDFCNKCYLCEQKAPISINVEHLKLHRGKDIDLKFDWDNLFWVCTHCNFTKGIYFDKILNCTLAEHDVLNWIICRLKPYPKELATIESSYSATTFKEEVANTVELLHRVYNGATTHKEKEAANLRRIIQKELIDFQANLITYYDDLADEEIKEKAKQYIKKSLKIQAPFTAFKYWIIKENPKLEIEFGDFLPT